MDKLRAKWPRLNGKGVLWGTSCMFLLCFGASTATGQVDDRHISTVELPENAFGHPFVRASMQAGFYAYLLDQCPAEHAGVLPFLDAQRELLEEAVASVPEQEQRTPREEWPLQFGGDFCGANKAAINHATSVVTGWIERGGIICRSEDDDEWRMCE